MITDYNFIQDAYLKCNKFVAETCKNRKYSDGHNHMERVADLALNIVKNDNFDFTKEEINIIIICAWLHDVNDHKYYYEKNEQKLNDFLEKYFKKNKNLIINITERVSFSREEKCGTEDWLEKLGKRGILMRNVVSDADKIDALDIWRCKSYNEETYPDMKEEQTIKNVIQHCDDKLLRLKDEFIITNTGKKIAVPLHKELVKNYNEMKQKIILTGIKK